MTRENKVLPRGIRREIPLSFKHKPGECGERGNFNFIFSDNVVDWQMSRHNQKKNGRK